MLSLLSALLLFGMPAINAAPGVVPAAVSPVRAAHLIGYFVDARPGRTSPESGPSQPSCRECQWEWPEPHTPYNIYHRFSGTEGISDCSTPSPGHPTHDCENGDGAEWSPGPCHLPCIEARDEVLQLTAQQRLLPAPRAAALQAAYPAFVSYYSAANLLVIRDCAGVVVGVQLVGEGSFAFAGLPL